ncbi:hypothetical protein BJG93_20865 [Paraburkholderia sprentiae WSM5005]|uniref:Uncharacterized protein n=1 Tax=Paraburkholderia sprentiae WSM5005 TaxID=754502 RepID=A0A1I9YSK3_9BURK|nr:hypothetical protein [Paraburkholderia sprentiae]APA89213.1 hypothetical protein BJG93_20865 [Paraburkholderia sprentiae WSM5005]
MRVRAVAAALAVWCVSEVALAGGYAEVWNPPEASGHVANGHAASQAHARKKTEAVNVKAAAKGAIKTKPGAYARQSASVGHAVSHVASASAGHGGKLAAHRDGPKHLAAGGNVKGGAKGGVKVAGSGQNRSHTIVAGQAAKHAQPHVQLARAKPAQAKVVRGDAVRADMAAAHPAQAHVDKVAAKPAVSRANPIGSAVQTWPDASANVSGIAPMGSVSNPATASSGSLPPILH